MTLLSNTVMRLLVALLSALTCGPIAAAPSGDFAKSGRVLTIEQWRSPGGIAWAVQDRQIVVYRMFDYVNSKDELVVVKPITTEQSKAIREALKKLPADAFGYCHDAYLSTDAPMLRLGFREDGALDSGGIEVSGHFPLWIENVVSLVSAASQPEAPITFRQVISEYRARIDARSYSRDIQKIDLRRRYGEPKPWWKFWE